MSILSVFIDESGDFGEVNQASPYYLVTLVLHEQNIDISRSEKMFFYKPRELKKTFLKTVDRKRL